MSHKDTILARPIATLPLSMRTTDELIYMSGARRLFRATSKKENDALRVKFRTEVTIGEVIGAYPPFEWSYEWKLRSCYSSVHTQRFIAALVKLKLTALDWHYLPQKTLTLKVMRTLSKEEWLDRPAFLLGTLTPISLNKICFDKKLSDFTVRGLLAIGEDNGYHSQRYFFNECEASARSTRDLLVKLGFGYEDGPFMQARTRRKFAERLAEDYKLGKRQAALVACIAEKEGWVRKSLG